MNTDPALRTPMAQQVLTLSLAALFTAGMLGAVLDIGADDQEALMASQADKGEVAEPQALATVLTLSLSRA